MNTLTTAALDQLIYCGRDVTHVICDTWLDESDGSNINDNDFEAQHRIYVKEIPDDHELVSDQDIIESGDEVDADRPSPIFAETQTVKRKAIKNLGLTSDLATCKELGNNVNQAGC